MHHNFFNTKSLLKGNYNSFGSNMPGREYTAQSVAGYRFGFNGMESNNENYGDGNSYSTEYRQMDARLARWLTIDPLVAQYPGQSPYISLDNSPIKLADVKGLGTGDDKKAVSFMVVGTKAAKSDKAMKNMIKAAQKSDWVVIYAKDADDAREQIGNYKNTNKVEVNNVMFASHGENKTASFNVGDRKYSMSGNAKAGESSIQLKNGGVEEVFKKYSNLDIKGTVLLQACFAGGTHNKGQDMIKSIAAWSQTPVMASQAWGNAYSSMNEKGFFFDNYDNSHGQSLSIPKGASNFWRHSQDYTDAISNLGKSSLAYPTGDGNANVISIQGTFYYNTDGTYGIIKRSEVLSKISKDQTTFYKNPRAYGWAN